MMMYLDKTFLKFDVEFLLAEKWLSTDLIEMGARIYG